MLLFYSGFSRRTGPIGEKKRGDLLKGLAPEVMEAVNLPCVSQRTRKASGTIQFASKGLRTKGLLV